MRYSAVVHPYVVALSLLRGQCRSGVFHPMLPVFVAGAHLGSVEDEVNSPGVYR